MEPREFGKYALLERVGKGGVGSVYRARTSDTGEIVAVKLFECRPDRPVDITRRLRNREVRMLLSVQHPNIVQFRETGEVGDDHYYTMEFVEHSLLERMRTGDGFKLLDKVHLLRQTASALAAVHHQAIVHRDVKPGNILLNVEPAGAVHAKLTDLGIAINVSETDIIKEQRRGGIPGTPKYMSPEQIRQDHLDGRSDIFSLGVVAYELLTGRLPFTADTGDEYMVANAEQTPVPPWDLDKEFPPFLSQMVMRMLAKDREERYDSDTLARDLQLVEQHLISGAPLVERTEAASLFYEPGKREARRLALPRIAPLSWALALGIVLAGGAAAWLAWPRSGPAPDPAPAPESARGPDALLEDARTSSAAGQNWRAALALRRIDQAALSAEQKRKFAELTSPVQEALSQDTYAAAGQMLEQQRDAEADVVLMRMKEAYPASDWTRKLNDALSARRQQATDTQRWDRAMERTYDLVRRRQYPEALAERRKLVQDFAEDQAKVQQARQSIADLLQTWGRYLQQTNPGADKIEEFFTTLAENGPPATGQPADPLAGALHLKLADKYQAASDFVKALDQYELAAQQGDADTGARARAASDKLQARVAETPVESAAFAREVAESGLGGPSWLARSDPRGQQTVADGILTMRIAAGEGACTVLRQTTRPLRNLGFTVGVQFRLGQAAPAGQGAPRAGLGISDSRGTGYELFFDGAGYGLSKRARGSTLSTKLCAAVGDESSAWHTLRFRYAFDTGRLAALLDGKLLDEQSVNLSDVRISLFLGSQSPAASAVDFQNFAYTP